MTMENVTLHNQEGKETNADVAHFSTLATNKQMYASKYLTYMPSKEVLAREIEQQKEIFRLRNNNEEEV